MTAKVFEDLENEVEMLCINGRCNVSSRKFYRLLVHNPIKLGKCRQGTNFAVIQAGRNLSGVHYASGNKA